MKKKIASLFLAGALICSAFTPALAAKSSFSDVTEQNYGWAIDSIESMTTDGIIKGYTDGTFRPAQSITHMEALILSARVLGYTKEENKDFTSYAESLYKKALADYDINYKGEVSYLLYKGVLKTSELDEYIGKDHVNEPVLRYQAAVLLTKVMGGEDLLDTSAKLPFTDASKIPAAAVPYVAYVNDLGLMGSMSETESIFNPDFAVNRVQMAVILYRIMDMTDLQIETGVLESLNSTTRKFTVAKEDGSALSFNAKASTVYLVNGKEAALDDFKIGEKVAVIQKAGSVAQVETFYEKEPEVVSGAVSAINTSTVTLEDIDTGKTTAYEFASGMQVTLEGAKSSVSEVKRWYYAELTVNEEGKVSLLAAEPKTTTVVGTVKDILLNPVGFEVEFSNDTSKVYYAQDSVTVKRNGLTSSLDNIGVGDRVSLTLTYHRISSVQATSSNFTVNGSVKEILISANPKLTVTVDGVEKTYFLSRDCTYQNQDATCSIYDLRLGASVRLKVESETVTSVIMQTTSEATTYTGVIESYNASYRLLNLSVTTASGEKETIPVFLKKNNGTAVVVGGQTANYNSLKPGQTVTAFGATTGGVFEANTIVAQ